MTFRPPLVRKTILPSALLLVVAGHFPSVSSTPWTDTNADYKAWKEAETTYDKFYHLPGRANDEDGVALHWTINGTHIHLAVAAETSGWVGFGLAENGAMKGADIVLFSTEGGLQDTHVLDESAMPIPDSCPSWSLIDSITTDDLVLFEAVRLLDTGDDQDHAIRDDANLVIPATKVIAAWGDTSTPTAHGFDNTARGALRFYGESALEEKAGFAETMAMEAEGFFEVRAINFAIPATETTYEDFCVSTADLQAMNVSITEDLHIIGVEPIVDEDAAKYVHHFILTGSTETVDETDCQDFPSFEIAYAWAPGDFAFAFPDKVGSPLGVNGFKAYELEIHYDNPGEDEGVLDSSGLRLYYTSKKREFDMGIYTTGDPNVDLFGQAVSESGGLAQHVFNCESSCSETYLGNTSVTVFRENLHMHKSGVSMTNEQIRDGDVLRTGTVQYWDFEQNGNIAVAQDPFDIKPGDGFRTTCNFDATAGEVFGLGSSDEMCMAFLMYYPRKLLFGQIPYLCGVDAATFADGCAASHAVTADATHPDLSRTFGNAPAVCPIGVSTIAEAPGNESSPTASPPTSNATSLSISSALLVFFVGFLFF